MKRNKKGFTLVELVIVIAVIAILAGVMVAVFSGVIRRANESAELQKVKNEEIAQKADDILKKIDNANWFSWEDFENSLAEKLTETYKKYAKNEGGATTEQIEAAVKKAIAEYAASTATENTSLTEAQVKAIVENALANAKLGGVTEAQVRTIVNTAVDGITTLSKSDVQKIVDAAVAKGLTADQVANVIGNSGLAKKADVTAVETKVDTVIAALNALNPVTNKDLEDKIIELLPVTKTAADATAFTELVGRLNSGSTIVVDFDATETALTIDATAGDKTLTIKGNKVGTLTVNAPKASLYVLCDVETLDVVETAQNSVHVKGKVANLVINKGRVVVEDGATVTKLTAIPSRDAMVKVTIEEEGTVTNLFAQYQDHKDHSDEEDVTNDYIVIENNGAVGEATITASDILQTTGVTTTNVTITNGANAKGTDVGTGRIGEGTVKVDETVPATIREGVSIGVTYFAGGTGTEKDPFLIVDYETFQHISDYYNQGYFYFKVKDGIRTIDLTDCKRVKLNGSFDGNGVVFVNVNANMFGIVGSCEDNDENEVVISNFTVENKGGWGIVYTCAAKVLEFNNVNVTGYSLHDWNAGEFVRYGTANVSSGFDYTINFVNCSCNAEIYSTQNPWSTILVGHTYPGTGHIATINVDTYTDEHINNSVLYYTGTGTAEGHKYYGMGGVKVLVNGVEKTATENKAVANVVKIDATKNPEKTEAGYSITTQVDTEKVVVTLLWQYTEWEENYSEKIPDHSGVGGTIGNALKFVVNGSSDVKVFEKITDIEIRTGSEEWDCEIQDGKLILYMTTTNTYIDGNLTLFVEQYTSGSNIAKYKGSLNIASKTKGAEWIIK